jgi:hypothetical protein
MRIMLVYQAGIANVFAVEAFALASPEKRAARLLKQADFHSCGLFAQGLAAAGAEVRVAACNMAGDIKNLEWDDQLDNHPWHDKFMTDRCFSIWKGVAK